MNEEWKDIPGYENLYQASNIGNIRAVEGKTTSNARYDARTWKGRVLKQKKRKRSTGLYDPRVDLWKNGTHKTLLVSRLVALTWCDGYKESLTVNHIDGNPLNNNKDNLEWVTRTENIQKGFASGLYASCFKKCRIEWNGNSKEFDSYSDASLFLGMNKKYVSGRISIGKLETVINGTTYKIFP